MDEELRDPGCKPGRTARRNHTKRSDGLAREQLTGLQVFIPNLSTPPGQRSYRLLSHRCPTPCDTFHASIRPVNAHPSGCALSALTSSLVVLHHVATPLCYWDRERVATLVATSRSGPSPTTYADYAQAQLCSGVDELNTRIPFPVSPASNWPTRARKGEAEVGENA